MSDLRYTLRQLARSRGFTAVAALTFALDTGTARSGAVNQIPPQVSP